MRRLLAAGVAIGMGAWLAGPALGEDLTLGRTTARSGQTASVPLTFHQPSGAPAAAITTDIRFDVSALAHPRCEAGAALTAGTKTVKCVEQQPGLLRLLVFGLNLDTVPNGEVARVLFDIQPAAHPRSYRLRHAASAADAKGKEFPLTPGDGIIRVERSK